MFRQFYFGDPGNYELPLALTDAGKTGPGGVIYGKGMLVLDHMRFVANRLSKQKGRELFSEALRLYLTKNGGKSVHSAHLQAALEKATGMHWGRFFKQWVHSPGHPIVRARYRFSEDKLSLTVSQRQAKEHHWGLFTFPLSVAILGTDGEVTRRIVEVYGEEQTFDFSLNRAPRAVALDPQWRLPAQISIEQSREAWLALLADSPDEPARIDALRKLVSLSAGGEVPSDVAEGIVHRPSYQLKSTAFDLFRANAKNRRAVERLVEDTKTLGGSGLVERFWRARAAAWLVTSPTPAEEAQWRALLYKSDFLWERMAALEVLARASLERAQAVALERLGDPLTRGSDRGTLVSLLARKLTAVSEGFLWRALETGADHTRLSDLLGTLRGAHTDRPDLVPPLIEGATRSPFYATRGAFIGLLGEQRSSRPTVCRALKEILTKSPPELEEYVKASAEAAEKTLQCP
jgi:hypothetical protein